MKGENERLSDFKSRLAYTPDSVYLHRERGWRYIPIHPFADEPSILIHLSGKPQECIFADAYWEVDGDVVFVEMITEVHVDRVPGLYCRTRSDGGNVASAVLVDGPITRARFEEAMRRFHEGGRLLQTLQTFPHKLTQLGC